jgi:hypothetical protein
LHLSYGLFYTRKHALSRVAQLFMTQLRRIEADIQAREQRALLRLDGPKRRSRKQTTRRRAGAADANATELLPAPNAPRRRTRKTRR